MNKINSDEIMSSKFAGLMLDMVPMCCLCMDESYHFIACNEEAVHLFGLSYKQECLDEFYSLSPKFQSDGRLSVESAHEKIKNAFDTGYMRFEWLHKKSDGVLIPTEVTLKRAECDGQTIVIGYIRDMRESVKQIAKMREMGGRAQIMLDATPLCANFWDKNFDNIDCNQEAVKLFDLSGKQEYLDSFFELSPEYQPCGRLSGEMAVELVTKAFEEGYCRFEWLHQKLSGEPVPCEITLVRVEYKDDFIVAGYTRDLRELKATMAKMREADERTQIMLDATPLCSNFWDKNFNNIDCNQEAVKLFELSGKQEYLDRFFELSPEYQPCGRLSGEMAMEFVTKAFGEGYCRFEWLHQKLNGEPMPCEITLVRVKYKDDFIVVGYTRDLRELKATTAKMREADERTQIMLDATPLCCNLWDKELNNIDCNQEAVKLFELSGKQEYLDRFFELSPEYQPCGTPSSEKAEANINKAFGEGYCRFEWMHQKLNGEPMPCEITLVRVKYKDDFIVAGYTRDLRELKATTAKMCEADERTQIMLDATPLCCNLWDKDLNNVDCNQEAVTLFELSGKQEYLDRFFELSPEYQPCGTPSSEKAAANINKAFEEGYCRFEWMHQKLNGEPMPCEITLVRVKYKDDFNVAGYTRDLRELKATTAKMREADERTQIMLDATPLCCNLWNKNFNNIDCNQEAVKLFDLSNKQEYLDRFFELSPAYQPCGRLSSEKAVEFVTTAFEEGYCRFEWMHQKLNGEPMPCEITLVRVKYKDDFIVAGYTRDLRELKATMARMREADERTQIMLDATPLCSNFWDKNFNNIDCNQEAVNLFELSGKQEYLDRFFDLSPEYQPCGRLSNEMAMEFVTKAFGEGYCRFEWLHQKLNGEPIPCEITLVRVKYKEDFIVVGYTRDLREFKAMLQEMRRIEIAEESSKAKSRFLATVSHEIRTPMNAILGITEIQRQNESLTPDMVEAFSRIYSSANTLLRIINDILDLSKIEAGKLELITAKYDVASMLGDTALLNVLRINSRPIEFLVDIDENTPSELLGDELRIKQILNNVLSNAFKYTEQGVVKLSVSAEIDNKAGFSDLTLVFRISDTGQGMTPNQVRSIFEEYSRFNLEANRQIEGIGLGMSITQHLIKMMNGTIDVESEPGKGSTFTVRLPQKNMGSGPLGRGIAENLRSLRMDHTAQMKKVQLIRKPMPEAHVLVVDDVETNLYVAKGLLAPYGLSADTVMSGYEAIETLKSGKVYDIIFMDHMMPQMDGIEATARIRNMGGADSFFKKVPVIALTANAVSGTREMLLENGFDDFLSKPIDLNELNLILNRWIPEAKQGKATYESAKAKEPRPEHGIDIAGVDINAGLDMSGGTLDVYIQILAVYLKDGREKIEEIKACLETENLPLYTTYVHALKSASANIGALEISRAAKELEAAALQGDMAYIQNHNAMFLTDLEALLSNIWAAMPKQTDKNGSESIDIKWLKTELARLSAAMDEYDTFVISEITNNLKKFLQADGIGDEIEKILNCELIGEYEEASLYIDELLSEMNA